MDEAKLHEFMGKLVADMGGGGHDRECHSR
jgi:hypothetical protein